MEEEDKLLNDAIVKTLNQKTVISTNKKYPIDILIQSIFKIDSQESLEKYENNVTSILCQLKEFFPILMKKMKLKQLQFVTSMLIDLDNTLIFKEIYENKLNQNYSTEIIYQAIRVLQQIVFNFNKTF